jgi:hypothetical protein
VVNEPENILSNTLFEIKLDDIEKDRKGMNRYTKSGATGNLMMDEDVFVNRYQKNDSFERVKQRKASKFNNLANIGGKIS